MMGNGYAEEKTVSCEFSVWLNADFDVIRSREGGSKPTLELANDGYTDS